MPDAEITHAIDVSAVIGRKRAAIAAHASQIGPESFFLAMPDELFAMAFGTEWFVDPGSPRRGRPQRTDLLLA
jgi:LmbE family N-acetylglucosaminyl deacetylase